MATLNVSLTVSTTDATSDRLGISVSDALTTTIPAVNIARVQAPTSGQINLLSSSVNTSITYVYVKNTDSTNFVTLKLDDATEFAVLQPSEFLILPLKASVGLEATADTAACVLEYGYWTKSA